VMDRIDVCGSAFYRCAGPAPGRAQSNDQAALSRDGIRNKERSRMAEKFGRNRSTGQLRAEIAHSRERVARDLRGLQYELDFPQKLRRSFRVQTVSWITAAAAVGTLIVLLPMRNKQLYFDTKITGISQSTSHEARYVLGTSK